MVGGVLLGAAGLFAWNATGYRLPPGSRRRLRSFTVKEFLVIQAIAARILRRDRDDLPSTAELDAAGFIDGFVVRLPAADRRDLSRLVHVVEHVAPWLAGHSARFTRLDGYAQDAVLRSMMTSKVGLLRGAFDALKTLSAMAYFRDDRTFAALGYDGPLVGRQAIARTAPPEARG